MIINLKKKNQKAYLYNLNLNIQSLSENGCRKGKCLHIESLFDWSVQNGHQPTEDKIDYNKKGIYLVFVLKHRLQCKQKCLSVIILQLYQETKSCKFDGFAAST